MDKKIADKLVCKVTDDYNKMADEWSRKRWHLPSDIIALESYAKAGDRILDLGCGSGYLFELFDSPDYKYTGLDVSAGQIENCKAKYPSANFRLSKPDSLDFADSNFDIVYCLSTIHHVPSEEKRKEFLKEIKRVLAPDGILILTAWDIASHRPNKLSEGGEFAGKVDQNDLFVPFNLGGIDQSVGRYIHAFEIDEIRRLVKESGFEIIKTEKVDRGIGRHKNILVVARNK